MRKYYHTISYFVINDDGRNTIVIPRSDGPDKQFMLTIESENAELNAYLGQWPGWDISEEQFYRELREERERLANSRRNINRNWDKLHITCIFAIRCIVS